MASKKKFIKNLHFNSSDSGFGLSSILRDSLEMILKTGFRRLSRARRLAMPSVLGLSLASKLKKGFVRRSRGRRFATQRGFAMPVALGLGLVMLLVAVTMVVRSQGDQVTASSQQGTAQSLALAEGGIARTRSFLNQTDPNYSALLKLNYDPNNLLPPYTGAPNQWNTSSLNTPCIAASSITNITSGTMGNGTYSVLAYRYDSSTNTGTLLVEGKTENSSKSRIKQTFSVTASQTGIPGIFVSNDAELGNNDVRGVNGNVMCTNITNCNPGNTCPITTTNAKNAIGAGSQSVIDGQIYLGGSTTLAPAPTPPATACSTTTLLNNIECSITAGPYTNQNTTLTFPMTGDAATHVAGTPYHYVISTINANGIDFTIQTTGSTVNNPTNDPVYFYVSGNIDMGGNSNITHNNPNNPTAFRIYGTATTTQNILIASGATRMDAFIYAPNANMGINGTGTVNGLLWGRTFGSVVGANGNAIVQTPNTDLQTALGNLFISATNTSRPATSWERVAVP